MQDGVWYGGSGDWEEYLQTGSWPDYLHSWTIPVDNDVPQDSLFLDMLPTPGWDTSPGWDPEEYGAEDHWAGQFPLSFSYSGGIAQIKSPEVFGDHHRGVVCRKDQFLLDAFEQSPEIQDSIYPTGA